MHIFRGQIVPIYMWCHGVVRQGLLLGPVVKKCIRTSNGVQGLLPMLPPNDVFRFSSQKGQISPRGPTMVGRGCAVRARGQEGKNVITPDK